MSEFLHFAGFAFLVALAFGCAAQTPDVAGLVDTERPNVLMIVVDDLNDWVGYTGSNPETRTPHIDALAERGTAFTRAFSQFPLCGPARASLFSGLLPSSLGVLEQYSTDTVVEEAANERGTVLLHSYFAHHGYKTMAVGKLLHRHIPEGSVELSDALAAAWAVDRLREDHRRPFMLMVGFLRPHAPWYAPCQGRACGH